LIIQELIIAIVLIYFGSLVFFMVLALWLPKSWKEKKTWCVIVVFLYLIPICRSIYSEIQMDRRIAGYKARYASEKVMFNALCANAGEKIYKTTENVEGVLLLHTLKRWDNNNSRSLAFSALHRDGVGHGYIKNFLEEERQRKPPERGEITRIKNIEEHQKTHKNEIVLRGYSYVDVLEGNEIVRYKYPPTGGNKLEQERSPSNPARYAVDFFNEVNPEYIRHRIAQTTVTITDTWTNEVLAEKTWYAFAARFSGRYTEMNYNYLEEFSHLCPSDGKDLYFFPPTRQFVDQILKPKQEY